VDARFPTGRTYAWLALAVAAFALYGSLLPFHFRWVPFDAASAEFRFVMTAPSFGHVSRTNFLANTLLFIPIGFGIAGALLVDRPFRVLQFLWTAAIALAMSTCISICIEFLQIFVPGRVSARADIEAQAAGSLIGLLVWLAAGPPLTMWFRRAQSRNPRSRVRQAFAGYAALWIFVNLAPFDITFDLGELSSRFHSGLIAIVPFASAGRGPARMAWDAFITLASAIPLAGLGLTTRTGLGSRKADAFAVGAALVVLVEAAQVFIVSHAADVTDVIFGWIGVAIGTALLSRALSNGSGALPIEEGGGGYGRGAAIAAWCAVLLAYHWMPYEFTFRSAAIHAKLNGLSLLPFNGYNAGSNLNALNELLTKLGLAAPLGVIAAFVGRRDARLARALVLWIPAWIVIFGAIEAGQLFLPSRYPDPTDVLVGVTGATAGLLAGRWLRGPHADARSGSATRLE
jgi:glycopeptide antibiotics resistance protein